MRHLCGIVIVLQMAVLSHCLVQENVTIIEEPKPMYECFYEPAKSCPETGCIFLNSNNDTALCCNIKTPFTFKENIAGKSFCTAKYTYTLANISNVIGYKIFALNVQIWDP